VKLICSAGDPASRGPELGRLVVYLVPWMLASVAYTLAFPLVFLIFPALLIVILGPAAVQLMEAIAAQNAH
jgi:hypothetical protein